MGFTVEFCLLAIASCCQCVLPDHARAQARARVRAMLVGAKMIPVKVRAASYHSIAPLFEKLTTLA